MPEPTTSTTGMMIPTVSTSKKKPEVDINKVGTAALTSAAPASMRSLLAAIKPTFSIETGKTQGIGPQPSSNDPIAGVIPGSPRNISVTDVPEFLKNPEQTALHESIHLVQNNLTPEQRKAIPPDTGNPVVVTDPSYLKEQRKAGKTILQLPLEQQSYLMQFYHSKKQEFEKGYITAKEMNQYKAIYEPWSKDWEKAKLSVINPTDPNSPGNTIVTTPRPPSQPINLQQSTVQFTPSSTIPMVSPERTRMEQQTADMGQLIKDSNTVAMNNLAKPVSWTTDKQAKVDNAALGVVKIRPSDKSTPVSTSKIHHPIPTNTEDENKIEGGDTKEARTLREQLIKSRIADVENPAHKNPFNFTHPLDRQAATYAKAQRIIKNPTFAAMPQDQKNRVLSNYYDRYVIPVYQNSKIDPPNKEAWTSQIQKGFFKVSDFYEFSQATNKDAFSDLQTGMAHAQASAVQSGGHIGHAILMAGIKTDRKILGLANFFPGSALHSWVTEQTDNDARIFEPALKLSQDVIDRSTFWLDTHPSKSYTEKTGSFVGEQLVQLPLYETIAAPLGILGQAVSSAGKIGKAANFTRRMATSKAGQFAGRRITEAASSYIGDSFSETPQGDRAADMAAFMGLGIAGETFNALAKPISRAAMKRVAANNIAVGGKVFHETIADQAAFELEHNIVGTDAAGNPIVHEEGKFAEQMQAAQAADPIKHAAVTAEKISQNAMARQLYNKPLNQLSQLQRRKVRVELAHLASEASVEIPIHVPEVAKHEVQTKLAEDVQSNPDLGADFELLEKKYGKKIVDEVVAEEQDSIAVENGIKSTQGATARVGKNEELLAQANEKMGSGGKNADPIKLRSKEELAKLNPQKAAPTREQSHFQDFGETGNLRYNSGDQGYNVKFQSPVDKALYRLTSSTEKARAARPELIKKLDRYFGGTKSQAELMQMAHSVKEQLDAEVKSRRPNYDTDPAKHSEISFPAMHKYAEPARAQVETGTISPTASGQKAAAKDDLPKSYVSFKKQSLAHFTNPFTSQATKSKQSLDKFISGMDDADFVQEISDQMGNQIKFEKPYDMLLWGLHHSDDIPSPIVKRIKQILADQDPGATYQSMREEGKRLAYHIDLLAMSGRLDTEGNVFRSTVTSSFTGRTKWQKQLEKEVSLGEIENYKNTMGPYQKNFADQYNAGLKELAKLQMLRKKTATDADFFTSHDKIKKILADAEGRK